MIPRGGSNCVQAAVGSNKRRQLPCVRECVFCSTDDDLKEGLQGSFRSSHTLCFARTLDSIPRPHSQTADRWRASRRRSAVLRVSSRLWPAVPRRGDMRRHAVLQEHPPALRGL